ncbi:DUF928 domain-containing protein [Alkalinema sp. FACHB-956]|uniref:DUF928 domain-containing protein n=1 Tax=Alkalinema sp. FACHB-956 TaxID=2692768 RepID=UPI0016852090|nr:DUF928 domain-containing protein [Alkalinema sp. FACHB-956]MBD2328731.1 DUF928 domain-containing protein [Alkalinema sp. FACHB-956]
MTRQPPETPPQRSPQHAIIPCTIGLMVLPLCSLLWSVSWAGAVQAQSLGGTLQSTPQAGPLGQTSTFTPPPPPPDRDSPGRRGGGAGRREHPPDSPGPSPFDLFTPPPPPPDRDAPGNRGGGAGRGCGVGSQTLMALVPEYHQTLSSGGEITKVWGTTIAERPTLWFYVPYAAADGVSLEFVLQDQANPANDIYRTRVVAPATPGIVRVALPDQVPSLLPGKLYQWYLKARLQCQASQPGSPAQVVKEQINGWVQRVDPNPSLATQLQQGTPPQRATLYRQNGIWFDALNALAELRLADPNNPQLTEDWKRLLRSIGLEALAEKPIEKKPSND